MRRPRSTHGRFRTYLGADQVSPVGLIRGRGVWRFRRRNGRGRGGARTWRRSRVGDRRYRLGRYRLRRRRFWHWRCCHSTPLTRGAAGNPRRCLADHAGVLGDASWDEIRWPAPTRGRAMTRLRLHQTVRFSARSRQRSLPATRAVCLPSGALPAPSPPPGSAWPRLAITVAMTATHTAAQAASTLPTAVPVDGAPARGRSASGHARGPRERASAIPGEARSPPPEPRGEPRRAGATSSQRLSNQLAGRPTIWCP